jgi:hypothetical protein
VAAALGDPAFMDRERPRPELFGDGQAAERIVAALERLDRRRRDVQHRSAPGSSPAPSHASEVSAT